SMRVSRSLFSLLSMGRSPIPQLDVRFRAQAPLLVPARPNPRAMTNLLKADPLAGLDFPVD
ncbi:MAG: hypothetical protein AB7Q97_23050, partial [Gammaproteobacteria bacterium]